MALFNGYHEERKFMQIEANKKHILKSIFRAQRFKNKFLNKSSQISANNGGKYVEDISQT